MSENKGTWLLDKKCNDFVQEIHDAWSERYVSENKKPRKILLSAEGLDTIKLLSGWRRGALGADKNGRPETLFGMRIIVDSWFRGESFQIGEAV